VEVIVSGKNNVEMAIRAFRKKTQKEGIVKAARTRKEFEKPSRKKKRKRDESTLRRIKIRRGEWF
jgi:small subunit ribosomal protein S21